ncbi:hypothetical protein HPB49_015320 [Dermacentor silvarum]|uniref:Uncharacterized protein n=1 Tax=Dermacentor silvarum TaxID=543639 RepID=A0ACB8CXR8_DERSI|nr:hypothetical protein HPB49_015320 [Dermacentor silvarum]
MDWLTLAGSLLAASLLYLVTQGWLHGRSMPRGRRLPPGPPGLPLVGHVQFTHKDFHCNQAMKWAKRYGPVYRIRTASADMVILNDFQSIKKFLTKKEVLYRPHNWLFRGQVYGGVATLNGDTWVDNRRFCLHVLRDLGFGKTSMEEHVKASTPHLPFGYSRGNIFAVFSEECQGLVEKIAEAKGAPLAIQEYIFPSTSNNIAALVYGSRYPFEDPRRRHLDELLSELFKAIGAGTMIEFLPPFVRNVLTWLPSTRRTVITSKLSEFIKYTQGQIDEHKATIDEHFDRDFIDGYLRKIKEHEKEQNPNFQQRFLLGNVLSFFIAGSNVVAVTIHWHMLNFANNPDTVQARVQREIDEVVGKERQPYVGGQEQDALHDGLHLGDVPLEDRVASRAGEDTVFDDYFIPKGTTVIPNVWAVHNDPTMWKEPSKFDPTRFLREDGSLIQPKPEHLIPFSIGKRMCPGEILASVEIFLYITYLLQKFRILPEEGKIHDLDSDIPLEEPNRYKLMFTPRYRCK